MDFHFTVLYGVLVLLCVYIYLYYLHFGVYVGLCLYFRCLVFLKVDVAHMECGYILNLLCSQIKFNIVD